MTPFKRLKAEFLSPQKVVCYRPGLEGQQVEGGIVYVGNKAGPSRDLSNLCHEMAHFVEIDDARMNRPSWGLSTPRVWVYDRWCVEPVTRQITEREIRVAAYQANLQQHIGMRANMVRLTSAFEHLPDFIHVPVEDGRSAYGDDAPKDMDYRERQASRLRWIANRAQELRATYTIERFVKEWARKTELLIQVNSAAS